MSPDLSREIADLTAPGRRILSGVPEGFDALVLTAITRASKSWVIHIARDDVHLAVMQEALRFFAPDIKLISLPAWDCLPYDRVSPNPTIIGRRMATLSRLTQDTDQNTAPRILLTTINALMTRLVPKSDIKGTLWSARPGNVIDADELVAFLAGNGFLRTGTVREAGEYALRGGIIDIFPSGHENPVRLDLFGDILESIRSFDSESQRSLSPLHDFELVPASEVRLNEGSIRRFRSNYVASLGTATGDDPLYEAISAGRRTPGMEHWLPLFHNNLETLFDYLPDAVFICDHLFDDAVASRWELIVDYYQARKTALNGDNLGAPIYKPVTPESLYLTPDELAEHLTNTPLRVLNPFEMPEQGHLIHLGGRQGRNFASERAQTELNIFDELIKHIRSLIKNNKQVLIASWSEGARSRLAGLLGDHGFDGAKLVTNWAEAQALEPGQPGLAVLGLEAGFETSDLAVIAEQDILGDRLVRPRKTRRAKNFLTEASTLEPGDLVVHVDHGIARFSGLQTLEVAAAPHDCLVLIYRGNDKLYLPVENLDLLSRYGSGSGDAQLDRLGGSGWQARKARLKKRILDMADKLIEIAAARELKTATRLHPPAGVYEEFCMRFPFEETPDQKASIQSVFEDLASGRPMDRLICGDVGFGKTEIALRAAMITALAGKQVALVVPTTLLCRQHAATFIERFQGLPVNIRSLSRLLSTKDNNETKTGLETGQVDIVIGTHALLGKGVKFRDLALLIIDEEQHFGVKHKERLKQLRADVHVLTLTATPIPRTLQLALTGVRELSLIATPPVDRLVVRTFISPFDPVVVREALLREHYRSGQSFYVVPRISDIEEVSEFLKTHIPEVKVAIAHGRMSPGRLEDVMTAFYDGQYDVLLSTTIIESGLDIPRANTLIIHHADMFGLSQLYQLRGRVGRSKIRAYAHLTYPATKPLSPNAEKRLKVLQSLDSLGAGFSLASHDLDIRGAGNLLGGEQSGHIREVGFELYQDMLEHAVASLRAGGDGDMIEGKWSPQITIAAAVLIPEYYVADLTVRLGLYRRLSDIEEAGEIDGFAAELIDRFGLLPAEVEHLLQIVVIKILCRCANVEKLKITDSGASITFRNNEFPNPAGLIRLISQNPPSYKIKPDHRLAYAHAWPDVQDQLAGGKFLIGKLAELATQMT